MIAELATAAALALSLGDAKEANRVVSSEIAASFTETRHRTTLDCKRHNARTIKCGVRVTGDRIDVRYRTTTKRTSAGIAVYASRLTPAR